MCIRTGLHRNLIEKVNENCNGCGNLHLTMGHADLSLSLEPSPDYPQIACAAGDAWGVTIDDISNINRDLALAVKTVQGGRCAVVEVR